MTSSANGSRDAENDGQATSVIISQIDPDNKERCISRINIGAYCPTTEESRLKILEHRAWESCFPRSGKGAIPIRIPFLGSTSRDGAIVAIASRRHSQTQGTRHHELEQPPEIVITSQEQRRRLLTLYEVLLRHCSALYVRCSIKIRVDGSN